MGINSFWDVVKDQDRSILLAQLAADHYRTHGRPLRIAIDEADWRFNNLTNQQVYVIREKSNQPFKGIEKAIFYRICRWLTLNVQLLFVFDGPRRPAKRGRNGGNRVDYEGLRPLKTMLRHFRIPYHEAPGEAEAECARLQQLGIVDAVFSQDSDTLMFGCDYLVRDDRITTQPGSADRSKENTQKSAKSLRVLRAQDLQRSLGFDREGLVLFAMLSGGDYDTKGLPGCGHATACRAVKAGLGKSLVQCQTKHDCLRWRDQLVAFLQTAPRAKQIQVPPSFPDIKTLNKYNKPVVSSDEQLIHLRGLRHGWDRPIDEHKLFELTNGEFNIWGKLYLNWVGPVLLTRSLVSLAASQPVHKDNTHEIRLTVRRGKKNEAQPAPPPLERKLTFSPFKLTSLTRDELAKPGYWTGALDAPFDPDHRVEFEIPDYWLQKALPSDVLDPQTPVPKRTAAKRKRTTGDQFPRDRDSPKKRRKAQPCQQPSASRPPNTPPTGTPRRSIPTNSSHRTSTSASNAVFIDLDSDSDPDSDVLPELDLESLLTPVPNRSKRPVVSQRPSAQISRQFSSDIIDLGPSPEGSSEDDADERAQLKQAIELSLQHHSHPTPTRPSAVRLPNVADSDVTHASLDEIRVARLRHFSSPKRYGDQSAAGKVASTAPPSAIKLPPKAYSGSQTPGSAKKAQIECIDLTGD